MTGRDLDMSFSFVKTVEITSYYDALFDSCANISSLMHAIGAYYFPKVWKLERFQTASDLHGHSRSLAVVPFDKPHTISY